MQTTALIITSFLLAIVGGTGGYVLSGLLMNVIVFLALIMFGMRLLQQYHTYGIHSIRGESYKWLSVLLYIGFLLFNMLKETLLDPEYLYNYIPEGGILREYTDLLRGFLAFLMTIFSYQAVKNHKIFIILPPLCIALILLSQFLEAYGIIHNQDMVDSEPWRATPIDRLQNRPGGFLNPNMTSAVALIWLYITLESKLNTPVILKGISLLMALTVCLLTQSRTSILFSSIFLVYNLILTRNYKFLFTIIISLIFLIVILSYVDLDIVNGLLEKFTDRATTKEDSAAEREYLIYRAIEEMQNTPIFGHELYHLAKTYGVSSHNQTLEILNNFGLYGFITFVFFYIAFYHVNSIPYLLLCILPMLLFSHNFFENSAFQVALGFGYVQAKANKDAMKEARHITEPHSFAT